MADPLRDLRVAVSDLESIIYESMCAMAGARYDGIQETPRGRFLVVTEPTSGSTGYLALPTDVSAITAKLAEIRRRFE